MPSLREIVSVRTTAATASIVDVRSGNAPTSTEAIAATNTAKRCHAGAVRPAGTGSEPDADRQREGHGTPDEEHGADHGRVRCGRSGWRADLHPALETDGLALHGPVLGFENESPRELVGPGGARVTSGAADERPDNPVACRRAFAPQLAVRLVAALIGPDCAAHHAGRTVVEHDRFGAKSDRRAGGAGQQQRSVEIRNRGASVGAEARSCGGCRRRSRSPRNSRHCPVVTSGSPALAVQAHTRPEPTAR